MFADEVARRYVEATNHKDPSAFAALFTQDTVLHDPFFPEATRGRAAVQSLMEGILHAFSDMAWVLVGDPIEADSRAALVVAVHATNDGPLAMPDGVVPPTGKTISYESAVMWTFDSDGLIAEERSYFDATGVAAQLGMIG